MNIRITKPSEEFLKNKNVKSWPIWQKEKSIFDWHYDSTEECYIIKGKVKITDESGNIFEFGQGDFVVFEKNLSCKWEIIEDVEKHYNFI